MPTLKEFFNNPENEKKDMQELVSEVKDLLKNGDSDTYYAYHALFKFHILPHEFIALPEKKKAIVVAMIDEVAESNKTGGTKNE